MTAITDSLGTWIPQVQGQYINMDWNPQNKGFGAQCWDLAAHWSNFLGLPIINTGDTVTKKGRWPGWAGNMVDCFPQTPAIAAAYTLHGPDETGQPGDIAVWGDSYWYYPATHVAPLIKDNGPQLLCMSQNSTPSRADNPYPGDSSGPTTIQSLPRQGLIGLIRPNVGDLAPQGTITPTSEEDEYMPSQEWFDNLIGAVDKINNRVDMLPAAPEYWANLNGAVDNIHNRTADIGGAVLNHPVPYRDPATGQATGQTTTLGTAAGFNDFQHTATRETLLTAVRGIVDAVAAAPGPDAAKAAEEAYAAFVEKLAGIKLTITTGGE